MFCDKEGCDILTLCSIMVCAKKSFDKIQDLEKTPFLLEDHIAYLRIGKISTWVKKADEKKTHKKFYYTFFEPKKDEENGKVAIERQVKGKKLGRNSLFYNFLKLKIIEKKEMKLKQEYKMNCKYKPSTMPIIANKIEFMQLAYAHKCIKKSLWTLIYKLF